MRSFAWLAGLGLGLVGLAAPAVPAGADPAAGGSRTHAGSVVAVDAAAGRVVIEEMSPGTQIHRVDAQVSADTRVIEIRREPAEVVVTRTPQARDVALTYRWVERPLGLGAIRPGDFAVVELAEAPSGESPAAATRIAVTARSR
ncbi:MAG TPA: hypothetical protein VF406_02450 [Thermodesulfobacteriota bacterium]